MVAAVVALSMIVVAPSGVAGAQPQPFPLDSSSTEVDGAAVLEALAEGEHAGDPTDLLEQLDELRENPLDVNRAAAVELAQVPGMGPLAARAIVAHRERYGPFDSVGQLAVPGLLRPAALDEARPYLRAGRLPAASPRGISAPRLGEVLRGLRFTATQRLQRRLDLPRGYRGDDSTRAYPGSPVRVFTRLQARYRRNVLLNVTLEKDPGEGFRERPLGYDHVSASAGLHGFGRLETLVLGDFVAEFGQGVTLWRAAGMGKGSDATRGPVRSGRGLRPYGSVDESRFLRGAGATITIRPGLRISAFASHRRLDASLAGADSAYLADGNPPPGADIVATSLAADGLHRTPAELARRGALGETLVGSAVEARLRLGRLHTRLGAIGYRARFDTPIAPPPRPDTRFAFRGREAQMLAVYGDIQRGAIHAFGEAGRDAEGSVGAVAGAGAAVGSGTELLVVFRRYPRGFVTLHGYPFGERNGSGQNETGLYAGMRTVASSRITVAGYVDVYRFPWLRFNTPRPTAGREALLKVEYHPRRWLRTYAQARIETRDAAGAVENVVPGSHVGGLGRQARHTLRLHAEFDASRSLRLRSRIESALAHSGTGTSSSGLLLFHDVRFVAVRGVRVDARLTLFDTEDYAARLYQLESDVAGAFSLPVLYGRGARVYAAITMGPIRGVSIQAKLAATFLEDATRIGTGPDAVDGHRAADAGLQVRWAF